MLGQHPTNCISRLPFLASFLPRGERQPPCLGQCRPGTTRDPSLSQAFSVAPAPSPPRSLCHKWTAPPPAGVSTVLAGPPTAPGSGHSSSPLGSPGPEGGASFLWMFCSFSSHPWGAVPRLRSPLLHADWQHCTHDSTHRFGEGTVHQGPPGAGNSAPPRRAQLCPLSSCLPSRTAVCRERGPDAKTVTAPTSVQ